MWRTLNALSIRHGRGSRWRRARPRRGSSETKTKTKRKNSKNYFQFDNSSFMHRSIALPSLDWRAVSATQAERDEGGSRRLPGPRRRLPGRAGTVKDDPLRAPLREISALARKLAHFPRTSKKLFFFQFFTKFETSDHMRFPENKRKYPAVKGVWKNTTLAVASYRLLGTRRFADWWGRDHHGARGGLLRVRARASGRDRAAEAGLLERERERSQDRKQAV